MRIKLKEARVSKKLTQADVARYLNMRTASYQRIETGTRKGDVELWDALEDFFGIPQRELREISGPASEHEQWKSER